MKIYNRDFCNLTESEVLEWEAIKAKEIVHIGKTIKIKASAYSKYPEAVRHNLSLFPNNHLDTVPLCDGSYIPILIEDFKNLIDIDTIGERQVLNHIRDNNAYPIVASVLRNFNFGHHYAFVFPEFQLGTSYKVDYLIVGKNSGGYEFIFVELEAVHGRIVLANGDYGDSIRKGIAQVNDWDTWIDENYNSLSEIFNRLKNPNENLPDEFYKLDKSRIHYAIVAGRRKNYTKKTYRLRRKEKDQRKITLLHYDNLIDKSQELVERGTY